MGTKTITTECVITTTYFDVEVNAGDTEEDIMETINGMPSQAASFIDTYITDISED